MKIINIVLSKLNKLKKNKKQTLEIKFQNTKKQSFLQNVLYLLYHYGYITTYKFLYDHKWLILIININLLANHEYKLLTKPTYQFNIKKNQLNRALNTFQTIFYTDPTGVHLFPFHKQKSKAGILLFKIT